MNLDTNKKINEFSLTLVLVFHNETQELMAWAQAINSSIQQSRLLPKIILIDNKSQDHSSVLAKQICKDFHYTYIRLSENNMGKARQQALDICNTKWLAFIDADCRVNINWIKDASEAINLCGENYKIIGGISHYQSSNILQKLLFSLEKYIYWSNTKTPKQVSHMPTNNILIKTSCREKISFSSHFSKCGEDLDFSMQAKKNQILILIYPGMLVEHYQNPSFMLWFIKMYRYGKAQSEVFLKNKNVFCRKRFFPLFVLLFFLSVLFINFKLFFILVSIFYLLLALHQLYIKSNVIAFIFPCFAALTLMAYAAGELLAFLSVYKKRYKN